MVIKAEEEEGIEIIEMEETKNLEDSPKKDEKLKSKLTIMIKNLASKNTDSSEEDKEDKEDSGQIQDDYDI